jgi:hypothetical protein
MVKWITAGYHRLSRKTRLVLTAFVLLVFLGSGYYGAREAAPHSADHLTVTVTRTSISPDGPAGSVIYQHTFGRPLVVEAEHLLNDETTAHLALPLIGKLVDPSEGTQPYDGRNWHYHLAFTWHGVLVETADVTCDVVPEFYTLSALGLPSLWRREPKAPVGGFGAIIGQLVKDSGGSIPVSWSPTSA